MGIYINPPDRKKEDFLLEYGKMISQSKFRSFDKFDGELLPVCLVNNGPFTAAGVAYSHGEVEAFGGFNDLRPRRFFLVRKDVLKDVSKSGLTEEDVRRI